MAGSSSHPENVHGCEGGRLMSRSVTIKNPGSTALGVIRQLAAVAAIVLGAIGSGGVPHTVRAALVLIGGAILTAEHVRKTGATTVTTVSVPRVN